MGCTSTPCRMDFSFTAPADGTVRNLTIHVGGWISGGTLRAHLSAGLASDFLDITTLVNGPYDRNYTLTYSSALPAQTLKVSWVMTSGTGNVTLNGAALSLAGPDDLRDRGHASKREREHCASYAAASDAQGQQQQPDERDYGELRRANHGRER